MFRAAGSRWRWCCPCTAQVGELSEQLSAAQETVVVDHQVGVDFGLVGVGEGSVAGDGDAGALASVAVGVRGVPCSCSVVTVRSWMQPSVMGSPFSSKRISRTLNGGTSTVMGRLLRRRPPSKDRQGEGDGLGYGAWVLGDVFCIHSVTSCGVSTPRWMKRRRSERTLFFTAAQADEALEAMAPGLVVAVAVGLPQRTSVAVHVHGVGLLGAVVGVVRQEDTDDAVPSSLEGAQVAGVAEVLTDEFSTTGEGVVHPHTPSL